MEKLTNKPNIAKKVFAMGSLTFILAACGNSDYGYGEGIVNCKSGHDTELAATIGTSDENDPLVIIIDQKDYGDIQDRDSGAWPFTDSDRLDKLGEVVCKNSEGENVFTPRGALAREVYISGSEY